MNDATAKVALVTGASRGIGFEIARQLGQQGVHVLMTGREEKPISRAAEKLTQEGVHVTPHRLNLTCPDSIAGVAAEIAHRYGRLDILVNNAGIRIEEYGKAPSEQPMEDWLRTFDTNLFGTVQVTKALLPLIRKAEAGRIVNVSSLLGSVTIHSDPTSYAYSDMFKSLPAYSASKSAVNSWTAHLAYELRDTAVKVNAVHPGYTKTEMNDGAGDQPPSEGARTSVAMAMLGPEGPNGSFAHFDTVLPW